MLFLVYELVRDEEATFSTPNCNHIYVQVDYWYILCVGYLLNSMRYVTDGLSCWKNFTKIEKHVALPLLHCSVTTNEANLLFICVGQSI